MRSEYISSCFYPFQGLKSLLDFLSCALDISSCPIKGIAAAREGKARNQGKNTENQYRFHSKSLSTHC